ncbi:MAG: hypothetical protein OEV40_26920, partial [Acidimicrobiia bacterium]|nr:hypothetical protein [Acidimicrobiia bacterium]
TAVPTTTATTTTAVDTAAQVPSLDLIDTGIALRADGLGFVSFGEWVDPVDALSSLVGVPDSDEALTGPWPDASGCPRRRWRSCP